MQPIWSQPVQSNDPRLFFVFFIAIWVAVCFLIAQMGGWAELARHYRATDSFDGERWHFRSARMRLNGHYNGCLTVGANPQALYLSVLFLFRIGHPALCIPWQEISVTTGKTLWWKWTEFRFQQAPSVWLRFYGGLGESMRLAAGPMWPGLRYVVG
jgi:hypothetical protein